MFEIAWADSGPNLVPVGHICVLSLRLFSRTTFLRVCVLVLRLLRLGDQGLWLEPLVVTCLKSGRALNHAIAASFVECCWLQHLRPAFLLARLVAPMRLFIVTRWPGIGMRLL